MPLFLIIIQVKDFFGFHIKQSYIENDVCVCVFFKRLKSFNLEWIKAEIESGKNDAGL